MTPAQKLCSITSDEMSIKSNVFYNVSRDKFIGFYNNGRWYFSLYDFLQVNIFR